MAGGAALGGGLGRVGGHKSGRGVLNSEITAPLVFNTSMAPASLHGASTCMAPASLHGAFIYMAPFSLQGALHHWGVLSAKRPHHWRLPICMAPSPTSARRLSIYKGAHTSPCARQLIIPTRDSVCPPTHQGGNSLTK